MIKVFYEKEIRRQEKITCEEKQICSKDLMYQAGYVLTKDFLSRVLRDSNQQVLVIANTGNNGGDALVMYQELMKLGYRAKLVIVGNLEKASEDFMFYYDRIESKEEIFSINHVKDLLLSSRYVIDGIFGIGLKKEVSGEYKDLINLINKSEKIIYSIDIPSGIHPDSGLVMNAAVKANFTGVVGYYKLGNFLNDALDYHGETKLLDIGLIEGYSDIYYLNLDEVDLSKKRLHNSNKYSYGKVAFIGSSSMPGAINLAAISALRSGIGLAEVFYDRNVVFINLETIYKTLSINQDFSSYDCFVFGPGITNLNYKHDIAFKKILDSGKKVLVDAGGLKYLDLNKNYDKVIITPHLGELSSLLKVEKEVIKKDPIYYLRNLASKGIVSLLKGQTTIIQNKRSTYLIQGKNTGLATAGSGDCLAGIISSYLVSDTRTNSCVKGAVAHIKAANYARIKKGEVSLIASDIIENLYKNWRV
ncbi:MAG: NAD(P)H-hydrate dehydratase [Candidatus Izemoplasmatales bacterium]|nr:NAD(P)H-hydrate dehydratase [Candidatus Izemoplasmatales bacterium]